MTDGCGVYFDFHFLELLPFNKFEAVEDSSKFRFKKLDTRKSSLEEKPVIQFPLESRTISPAHAAIDVKFKGS